MSKAEKMVNEIERIMDDLQGSSANVEKIEVTHDVPGHTSIRIPSEQNELEERKS